VTVKTAPIALGAALLLAAGLIAVPDSAWAQRSGGSFGGGGGRGAFVGGGGGRAFGGGVPPALINGGVGGGPRAFGTLPGPRPQGSFHQQGFGHGFHHNKFFRPFFPFGIVAAAPAVVYAAPYYYPPPAYYPPAYYDPPVYSAPVTYSPPVSYAPAPTSNIVQFSTGRYELRGDGVSSPYTWVWIPNPPTSPPPPPPPTATAPPAAEPGGGSASSSPAPARVGQLYRWTDKDGVVHWTDRLDAVPEQYRQRVRTTPS
jgi:Domain of unknown function (DUF4124)